MGDNNKNYLILGYGLLGREIFKQTGWDFISREKDNFDFLDLSSYKKLISDYDTIINCIAYCNTYDKSRENHWNVNYKAVVQLVDHLSRKNKNLFILVPINFIHILYPMLQRMMFQYIQIIGIAIAKM